MSDAFLRSLRLEDPAANLLDSLRPRIKLTPDTESLGYGDGFLVVHLIFTRAQFGLNLIDGSVRAFRLGFERGEDLRQTCNLVVFRRRYKRLKELLAPAVFGRSGGSSCSQGFGQRPNVRPLELFHQLLDSSCPFFVIGKIS